MTIELTGQELYDILKEKYGERASYIRLYFTPQDFQGTSEATYYHRAKQTGHCRVFMSPVETKYNGIRAMIEVDAEEIKPNPNHPRP